jgi:glucose-6-phosphate isomerase
MFEDLIAHSKQSMDRRITDLFIDDTRVDRYSARLGEMLLDFSKTNIDDKTLQMLCDLADHVKLADRRAEMFSGARINQTEDRAVLHTALRRPVGLPLILDGEDVMIGVQESLDRMGQFCDAVRSGEFTGQGGAITDIVNIGIGGSDLGPCMIYRSLLPFRDGPKCHFVSNLDGADISDTLEMLNPQTTLVIIASKSFTTFETMLNAQTALNWMSKTVSDPMAQFVAISTALEATAAFGIPDERVFGFENWVGGRYSVWGPIGLSLMLAIGVDDFRAFLDGAYEMDQHFLTEDWENNLPVLLALVGVWHNQVCGHASRAVIPYDDRMARLPAYLQQLEMESNGKRVDMAGNPIAFNSGPIVWGEPGTNGQHAFFQLLHQGTRIVPCEFLIAAQGHEPDLSAHHEALVANCLAQSEALMKGRSRDEAREQLVAKGVEGAALETLVGHREFPGNRPSITIAYPKLTPAMLGRVIAMYEHRVFVEGVILGINSFDQWGVERGKELADSLLNAVAEKRPSRTASPSTQGLLAYMRDHSST